MCSNVWQTVCNSHNQQLEDTLGTLFQSLPPSSLPPLPALHAVQPQKFKFAQLKLNSKAAQLLSGTAEVLLVASSPCYVWSGPTSEFVCKLDECAVMCRCVDIQVHKKLTQTAQLYLTRVRGGRRERERTARKLCNCFIFYLPLSQDI